MYKTFLYFSKEKVKKHNIFIIEVIKILKKETITVNNYPLDKYQNKVIKSKAKNILVIAGAGSGKTMTIVGKIKSLIKTIPENEILCLTFTKAAAQSLENKLKQENIFLKVDTFHSLGFRIINNKTKVNLVEDNILKNIIDKHILKNNNLNKIVNTSFIEIGNDNFNLIQNNILKNSFYKDELAKTILTFINLFKSQNYNLNKFSEFHNQNIKQNTYHTKLRHKYFLNLTYNILKEYQYYLNKHNLIDYHDMLNKAIKLIPHANIPNYKYIIIDEYQDTSLNKCNLVKAIQNKTKAKVLAVGDDWQSIYRFTGSNLEIFTNFKKYFPKAKIIKLKNTYRNSQELIDVASKFIKKNPKQISKKLYSHIKNEKPIKIYFYQNNLIEIWPELLKKIKDNTLILGRNNKDINLIPKMNKNMHFLTIHKSKGLEAENVIIINLNDKPSSLPSKTISSEYLSYVIAKDEFPYEEERRLFYVALTRTKKDNYLIVNQEKPSIFVTELLKNSSEKIQIMTNIDKRKN